MKTYSARSIGLLPAFFLSLFLVVFSQNARAEGVNTTTAPQTTLAGKQLAYYYYGYYRHPGYIYYGPGPRLYPRYYRNYWTGWRPYYYRAPCYNRCFYNRWGAYRCVRGCY